MLADIVTDIQALIDQYGYLVYVVPTVVAAVGGALAAIWKAPSWPARVVLLRRYWPVVVKYWPEIKPVLVRVYQRFKDWRASRRKVGG